MTAGEAARHAPDGTVALQEVKDLITADVLERLAAGNRSTARYSPRTRCALK